jgi:hypothetical protein
MPIHESDVRALQMASRLVEEALIAVPVSRARGPIRTTSNGAAVGKGNPTDGRGGFRMGGVSRINGRGRFLDSGEATPKEEVKVEADGLVKIQPALIHMAWKWPVAR